MRQCHGRAQQAVRYGVGVWGNKPWLARLASPLIRKFVCCASACSSRSTSASATTFRHKSISLGCDVVGARRSLALESLRATLPILRIGKVEKRAYARSADAGSSWGNFVPPHPHAQNSCRYARSSCVSINMKICLLRERNRNAMPYT